MKIKGKSVRTLTKLMSVAEGIDSIRLGYDASNSAPQIWTKLGFSEGLETGNYLMPECIGKHTALNANGSEIIRKDLPKESQSRSFFTTWKDWHGQEHSGIQTRDFDMYPREYVEAPSENLFVIELDNRKFITTSDTCLSTKNEERNLHLMNLMLECFGEFEVIDTNAGLTLGTKLKMLQWDVLPPGEYPWVRAKPLIGKITERLNNSDKEVIESRMSRIANYNPDFLATGRGGFTGYFVYGFKSKSIFILESVYLDNATYVFDHNWEQLSKLTKNQIINGELSHKRIIHDKAWNKKLNLLMDGKL